MFRKGKIILFLLFAVQNVQGQIYLDSIYDFGIGVNEVRKDGPNFDALKRLSSTSYRTVFTSGSTTNLSYDLVVTDFDLEGELSNAIRIGDTTELFWPRSWVEFENDTVVLLSRYDRPYDTLLQGYQYGLMAFDLYTGEIYWQKEYGEVDRSDVPFGLHATSDGGFVMTGASYSYAIQDNDIYTVRVDHFGNILWESYVGGAENDVAYSIYELDDGGFLIGGRTRSFGNGNYDVYIVKLDSNGNELWYETYGGTQYDGGFDMIKTSNNMFLLSGIKNNKMGVYLINQDGSLEWSYDYGEPNRLPQLYGAFELNDGSFVGYGLADNPNDGSNEGCAIKINSEGQEIWERYYNPSNGVDYLTNGTATDDGGFLFIGQARNVNNGTSDAWILKVDSMGCPYPNCTVGIDELGSNRIVVDVWPNPANEVVELNVNSLELNRASFKLSVMDMQGRIVYNSSITSQTSQLNVVDWPNGLYLLTITGENVQSTVRVVVQH